MNRIKFYYRVNRKTQEQEMLEFHEGHAQEFYTEWYNGLSRLDALELVNKWNAHSATLDIPLQYFLAAR